ncbi:hypothetical protein PK69_10310 [Xanthomonas phaseoli pv. phaseoli]|uniref:SEC-C metal-binding domain-containing protein n=1 Tax=Xanthomonas TaxID=338 RepID=UPI000543A0F9|nr:MULTISPECIES: SEC-C metal-binding domain-containing protein [Xanthomonas]ATS21369.1 SEC-C domain-containing protein [Xanthomonas phaseoli pv. phaseoli]ATS28864.1 SEC-C domain-containing protein [Xanthomonas phaseoli pv. phaseoli]ATS36281.1 SEC-C domain-containing protein [Xanthomonas phaseoli pv. phaseoli]AZU13237.1 hypothetical protein AC609_11110 [Xanthomonas phaseoli pv. phaseoli]AZU26004.1 hypothetical protein AC611_11170 [Xanthomonas phaseoli pv. phaseoli]
MSKTQTERLNLRLPPDVKEGLQVYADGLGISLNAAAILAIRNFLPFAMKQAQAFEEAVPKARRSKAQSAVPHRTAEPVLIRKRVGRNEACPCFSGKKAKHCHPEWT